jgi:CheY-like chemotaxis protein
LPKAGPSLAKESALKQAALLLVSARKFEPKPAAFTESGFDPQGTSHTLHRLLHHGQADLKLPYVMGLDVLKWIRGRPQFDSTVVVVLTSSANPNDVEGAYRLHANAYLVKPSGLDKLKKLAESIRSFWLEDNQAAPVFGGQGNSY